MRWWAQKDFVYKDGNSENFICSYFMTDFAVITGLHMKHKK